jgi:hypothetical protein
MYGDDHNSEDPYAPEIVLTKPAKKYLNQLKSNTKAQETLSREIPLTSYSSANTYGVLHGAKPLIITLSKIYLQKTIKYNKN